MSTSCHTTAEYGEPEEPPKNDDAAPRGVRVEPQDVQDFGYSKGCPKCEATRRDEDNNSVHKNRACRKIIEIAMAQDDDQSKKLKDTE